MTRKQRRLTLIGAGLGVLGLAAALVLFALKDSIVFFNSPTDVVEKHVAPGSRIRLGGLVKEGTLKRGDNLQVSFEVTDGNKSVPVSYTGILPDLFREGQGVVNVPIIYFSVKWWNTLHQGSSISMTKAPSMAQTMLWGMLLMALCFWMYSVAMTLKRVRAIILEREAHTEWVHQLAEVKS